MNYLSMKTYDLTKFHPFVLPIDPYCESPLPWCDSATAFERTVVALRALVLHRTTIELISLVFPHPLTSNHGWEASEK